MRLDIALDGVEPRGADAAACGDRCCIARRPKGHRDEIAQLGDGQLPHLRHDIAGSSINAPA